MKPFILISQTAQGRKAEDAKVTTPTATRAATEPQRQPGAKVYIDRNWPGIRTTLTQTNSNSAKVDRRHRQ